MTRFIRIILRGAVLGSTPAFSVPLPPLPTTPPAFVEDWSRGKIDPAKWYPLRKKWGEGNHGVVPENVRIETDTVIGTARPVLRCEAHGDQYDGPVRGLWGKRSRVGGVLVSKPFFASGRFEVVMKIGDTKPFSGCPANPRVPAGSVPAIWTYAFRSVKVPGDQADDFSRDTPLYNPFIQNFGRGLAFYWSELDFPEFGKGGRFDQAMYNTFLNRRHDSQMLDLPDVADGKYHTYTSVWETERIPLPGIRDEQVVRSAGYWWVNTREVAFASYEAMPLVRRGANDYLLCRGKRVRHWVDGVYIAENTIFVPCMAAQLNLGIWLPDWAGKAPWSTSSVRFASIRIWPSHDPGDVTGILIDDITNNIE